MKSKQNRRCTYKSHANYCAGLILDMMPFLPDQHGKLIADVDARFRCVELSDSLSDGDEHPQEAYWRRHIRDVFPDLCPSLKALFAHMLRARQPQGLQAGRCCKGDNQLKERCGKMPTSALLVGTFQIPIVNLIWGLQSRDEAKRARFDPHTILKHIQCPLISSLFPELSPLKEMMPLAYHAKGPPIPLLSTRERQVLRLIGVGKTTKEVAVQLSISGLTVAEHRKNICRKLDIHSTAALVARAATWGTIGAPQSAKAA